MSEYRSMTVRFTNATQCFQVQCSRHAIDQSPVLKDALEMCDGGVLHLHNPRVSAPALRLVLTAMSRGAEAGAAAEAANAVAKAAEANAAEVPVPGVPRLLPLPVAAPWIIDPDDEYYTAYNGVYHAAAAVDMVECMHALHWLDLLDVHYGSLLFRNGNIELFEYMAVIKFLESTATDIQDIMSSPAYEFAMDVFSIQPKDPVPYLVSL